MKKLLAVLLTVVSATLFAADGANWSFFQLGFWFDWPPSTVNRDVYGVKVGAPFCSGRMTVDGVEASILGSATDHINGVQASWTYNQNIDLNGIQATFLANRNTGRLNGLQASLAYSEAGDLYGLQGSFVTVNKSVTGVHGSSVNVVRGPVRGGEFGVFTNVSGDLSGVQVSLVNFADKLAGIQLGAVNFAKKGGVQFGLLNFNSESLLYVFPLINFSF